MQKQTNQNEEIETTRIRIIVWYDCNGFKNSFEWLQRVVMDWFIIPFLELNCSKRQACDEISL